ncbi:hypothetical protein [Pseudophaeobacter sp.]|uniref:hypothetical protein n=1 Tax=Pseudophaeobacter sp. TaxID=1971739 RepID=UPI0032983104
MADLNTADTVGETPTRAILEKALHKAHQTFGNLSCFRGVDIGYRWTGGKRSKDICLRLHVQEKLPLDTLLPSQVFPTRFEGIPLDVIAGGFHPSLEPGAARRASARQPYTMGGLSVGRCGEGTGTIGLVVIDTTTGKPGILSNWHVLAGPRARRNDPIMQPGEDGDGFDPRNRIANLSRWMLDRNGDAALAELLPDQPWLPLQFGGFENITKARAPRLGEILCKTSKNAPAPRAHVDGMGLYRLQYETRPGVFEYRDIKGFKLVSLEESQPHGDSSSSPAGDSGTAWISAKSGEAVGLQFGAHAGSSSPSSLGSHSEQGVIACALPCILEQMQLRLAGFEDLLAQNGQDALLTVRQRSHADLSCDPRDRPQPAPWPHPRHWTDASAPETPVASRPNRIEGNHPLADIVPLVRISPSGGAPDRAKENQRGTGQPYNLVQSIWTMRLYPALLDYDPNFRGVFLDESVSQRISTVDERSIHAFFARLINGSVHFDGIGLKQMMAADFQGSLTYMQVCERINALQTRL